MTKLIATLTLGTAFFLATISAQASLIQYSATLNAYNVGTYDTSPATGSGLFVYDDVAHTLLVEITFSDLQGYPTAACINAPTSGGPTWTATKAPFLPGFPVGVTSGSYSNTLDLTSDLTYNPSYLTLTGGTTASAELALADSMAAGEAYMNIHTTLYAGGEILGYLEPIPEPATLSFMAMGCLTMIYRRRKQSLS